MKKKKIIATTKVPLSLNQEKSCVEIRRWHSESGQRIDVVFRTDNSYVSHSLSLEQFDKLKRAVREFV